MEKNWAELEKKFNLSPAQQHILFLLSTNNNELTPTQISELGCWHLSTITRLLKPLKDKGLVQVVANVELQRYKRVLLTEKGKELILMLMNSFRDMEQLPFQLDDLSESELESFLAYGEKLLGIQKGEAFIKKLLNARVENYDYI